MINLNKFYKIAASVVAIVVLATVLGVVFSGPLRYNVTKKAFYNTLDSGIWDTDTNNDQTDIYGVMYNHMYHNNSGKTPKLLFVGYDGCVANAVGLNRYGDDSGIYRLATSGGMAYLAKAGGENIGDQQTSTAPGWASIFTGTWGSLNGVVDNDGVLNTITPSLMYTLGKDGIKTTFSVIWQTHLARTYNNEVEAAKLNNYAVDYNLETSDAANVATMLSKIKYGDEQALFCILEATDAAGHGTGFSINNPDYKAAFKTLDSYANQMISEVYTRESLASEDWLIVLASDHGGVRLGHGGKTPMESTVWVVTNKKIELKKDLTAETL